MSSRLTCLISTCLALGLIGVNLRADDEAGNPNYKAPSLDELLLEGLGDGEPAAKALNSNSEPSPSKPKSPLDEDLLRELDGQPGDNVDGEDIGPPSSSPDPLVAIGRQMRDVESRLTKQKLDNQTRQLQDKILADLAVLMQECKKQCHGGGKPGSKSGKPGQGSQAGNNPAGQAPSDAARDSTDNLRNRATEHKQNGALVNAMKESWGNLPEHAREHLRNMNTDVFLPKYELMLEKYFKRLGEENANE